MIKKDNKFADAYFEIASCYLEKDLISIRIKAENVIESALNIDPDNITYLFFLSNLSVLNPIIADMKPIFNETENENYNSVLSETKGTYLGDY